MTVVALLSVAPVKAESMAEDVAALDSAGSKIPLAAGA
jgi:hypothetical protein